MIVHGYSPAGAKGKEIDQLIGITPRWLEMLKRLTSPMVKISECSAQLAHLSSETTPLASIELRSKGVMIHFKNSPDHAIWAVPFELLTIFKSGTHYAIYSDNEFCKFGVSPALDHFFAKVNRTKSLTLQALDTRDSFLLPEA